MVEELKGRSSRLLIAGTHSGCGKTTVTMGLLKLLSRNRKVQPFKVGPDYIDPMFHSHITGNKCRNLDSYILSPESIGYLFHDASILGDISVIEGVMGLYDGASSQMDIGSSAHIAKILNCPVILVVDAKGMSRSAAATVMGYTSFDPELNIKGVLFNNVGSEGHYKILRDAVESYSDVKVVGYLSRNPEFTLPSRHLGLVPESEINELDDLLEAVADELEKTIDMTALIRILDESSQVCYSYKKPIISKIKDFKVAVAYDKAFNFYYWDNIQLLEKLGGEITFYSPLKDSRVPEADLLYLGGGFPEVFAADLAKNRAMLEDVKKALRGGMTCLAECGGYMYLTESIEDLQGQKQDMVGFISGEATMTKKLQRFGYAKLTLEKDCLYGHKGDMLKVHEFHRSLVHLKGSYDYRFTLEKERLGTIWNGGVQVGNTLAGYPHIHWYSNLDTIKHVIEGL